MIVDDPHVRYLALVVFEELVGRCGLGELRRGEPVLSARRVVLRRETGGRLGLKGSEFRGLTTPTTCESWSAAC